MVTDPDSFPPLAPLPLDPERAEWLEPDGLGGYASGTAIGLRTRRYHALLLVSKNPPVHRMVLVNGVNAVVEFPADGSTVSISSQRYGDDVVAPDARQRIVAFTSHPWPRWRFALPDGRWIDHELFVRHGSPLVCLSWRLGGVAASSGAATGTRLRVTPFLSGRDFHSLHHENANFRFDVERASSSCVRFAPYEGVPAVDVWSNGEFAPRPLWYRDFVYTVETERGLDDREDLAAPGEFVFELSEGPAYLVFDGGGSFRGGDSIPAAFEALRAVELERRERFRSRLLADSYFVRRGDGVTLIAGYPWFSDWGRDTFIALRGLALATGRLDDARRILLEWSEHLSDGMLPNRFPDGGEAPEYNSVDAALWFLIAGHRTLEVLERKRRSTRVLGVALVRAARSILGFYARGARHGIRVDGDGLLRCGEPGVQLTWMDARVRGPDGVDRVVTPRIGKPVEIQALWLNALWCGLHLVREFGEGDANEEQIGRWQHWFERGSANFPLRFWNEQLGSLDDIADLDHQAGLNDATLRPNQILAVGGLPLALLDGERARRVVDIVETRLWTPLGLRTLDPEAPAYIGRYEGGVLARDGAYHQGTAWPWLLGPFVEAWVRVRGDSPDARSEARRRFVEPILRHLDEAGLGHVSEIADGDAPHMPRGAPFQAWSLGELIWLEQRMR